MSALNKKQINANKVLYSSKTKEEKQELVRKYPALFTDVWGKEEEETVRLFPTLHYDDNSIDPPKELSHLINNIEIGVDEDLVSDFDQGIYEAVTRLLATPVALLQSEAKALLQEILDNLINAESVSDESLEDDACSMPSNTIIVPPMNDDISDDEMLASFKEPKVLQGD